MPLAKEKVKIGVVYMGNPFQESSGASSAHQLGIIEMKRKLNLEDKQMLYKTNVDDRDPQGIESAIRELVSADVNIIIATAEGYAKTCAHLAEEYPDIVFAQVYAYVCNGANLTDYYGRVYQARYLSGIVAGLKTATNKIGYVASMGKNSSQVMSGLNAFALGVEKVNPEARVFVKATQNWHDPAGETLAARELINKGCDIIAQHCDTPAPQKEAERAGKMGIGYNTDMSINAPKAVLTSVLWRWGVYYTNLVFSVVNGTFVAEPYFGSMKDGLVELAPLNESIMWEPETIRLLFEERKRIETGSFDAFIGINSSTDVYYHTVVEL